MEIIQTKIDLTTQTNKVLVEGNIAKSKISDSYLLSPKIENPTGLNTKHIASDKKLLSDELISIWNKIDDIQNLVDSGDTLTSIAEVIAAYNAADANLKDTITTLAGKGDTALGFVTNRSSRFQETYDSYIKASESFLKAEGEVSRIEQILNSGVNPDTTLPLTQEEIDSLNLELEKNRQVMSLLSVYAPFDSFTSLYSYIEDVAEAKLQMYMDKTDNNINYQPQPVAVVTLTEQHINAGVVSVRGFIGEVIMATLNGLGQDNVQGVKDSISKGHFTEVYVPVDANVGDVFRVVALVNTNVFVQPVDEMVANVSDIAAKIKI